MMWKTIVFYFFTGFLITPLALGHSLPQAPPSFSVSPGKALIDEIVRVRVTGLRPRQAVTIKASMKDAGDRQWQSEASFLADRHGVVDCGRQAPISGSYKTVDPMGLFWSMAPVSALAQKGGPLFRRDTAGTGSVVMNFDLVIEGRTVASAQMLRLFAAPEVRVREVREDGLIGRVYELPTAGRRPAILVLTGGAGGIQNRFAPLLASHGYTVFSLAYFGVDPLPRDLREIPLEYFARAIAWLRSRPSVDRNRVGILGGSKGGELALLLASTFPEIKAVVGYVPSSVVWEGAMTRVNGVVTDPKAYVSSWTYRGQPLPYLPKIATPEATRLAVEDPAHTLALYTPGLTDRDAVERAVIPVEKINGAVLLLSGRRDVSWPSYSMSEMVIGRLRKFRHKYPYQHLWYKDAGHTFEDGYLPSAQFSKTLGGTPEGNARAQADSWPKVLRFLKENLAHR